MRRLLLFSLFASLVFAQNPNTAVYPGGTAADTDLFVATNNAATALNGSITSSATSIVLTSGTGFTAPVIIAIESEIIHCSTLTSATLSGCTRGSEGTPGASHSSGVTVTNIISAWHHNQVAAEVKAIEGNAVRGQASLTTANAIPKQDGTTGELTQSGITVDSSNNMSVPGNVSIGVGSGNPGYVGTSFYSNDASTGTVANKLAKISAANTVILAATTDTDLVLGVCVNTTGAGATTCGTTGHATVVYSGIVGCVFDGATTYGHWVQISSSSNGECHDAGSSLPSSGQILGIVLTTNGSGGTYNVALQIRTALNSSGSIVVGTTSVSGGTSGDCLYNNSGVVGNQACASGGGASITQGTYSSLPGTCTTNDLYFVTDSVYNAGRCSATNTWSWFLNGRLATPPGPVSGWTGVNTGSNWTANDAAGAINLQITNNSSLNWRILEKAQPSTPYAVTFFWKAAPYIENTQTSGIYFYDGTKLEGMEIIMQTSNAPNSYLRVEKITNVTTDSSSATTAPVANFAAGIYGCLSNTGTTMSFQWSLDGTVWNTLFSESVGTFMTPTSYGFGGLNVMSATSVMSMSIQSVRAGTSCGS